MLRPEYAFNVTLKKSVFSCKLYERAAFHLRLLLLIFSPQGHGLYVTLRPENRYPLLEQVYETVVSKRVFIYVHQVRESRVGLKMAQTAPGAFVRRKGTEIDRESQHVWQ